MCNQLGLLLLDGRRRLGASVRESSGVHDGHTAISRAIVRSVHARDWSALPVVVLVFSSTAALGTRESSILDGSTNNRRDCCHGVAADIGTDKCARSE